jgi:hypothetical protein
MQMGFHATVDYSMDDRSYKANAIRIERHLPSFKRKVWINPVLLALIFKSIK